MENATSSMVYVIEERDLVVLQGEVLDAGLQVCVKIEGYTRYFDEVYDSEAEAYVALLEYTNKSIKYFQEEIDECVVAKKRIKEWLKGNRKPQGTITIVDIDGGEMLVPENEFLTGLLND